MKTTRKFLFLVVFFIFLLLGFRAGSSVVQAQSEHEGNPTPQATQAASQPATTAGTANGSANGQTNILLIGVDELENATPQLKSVWLVLSVPASPGITLLPLYPDSIESGPANDAFLEEVFALDPDSRPAKSFLEALGQKDLWWNNYVVVDETGLAELIDLTGGLMVDGETIDGKQAVTRYSLTWDNRTVAIQGQTAILRHFCRFQGASDNKVGAGKIFERLSGHMQTDLSEKDLDQWLQQSATGGPSCKFVLKTQAASSSQLH